MKIVHVYKDFDPPIRGGMEGYIAQMCRYQQEWAEVSALTCSRSLRTQSVQRNGTAVKEVGEWGRLQGAPLSPAFPWHMRRLKADIVVVHVPNPTAELGYLMARPPGRLVVRYHSDVVRQRLAMRFYGAAQMKFLRQAAIILPTSAPYLRTSTVLQQVADRCRVVPLGIPTEKFVDVDSQRVAELRDHYGEPYVLFCGRHRYYKGLEYAVRAAPHIKARVVLAGTGPEKAACENLAKQLGVDVAFPGNLSDHDLIAHLHGSALALFPSVERSEAFGAGILEAHVCGRPVVATTLGTGVEYANLHGETGLNVPPRDADALAAAVNELIDSADRREAMGAFAKERVQRDFTAAHIARQEYEIYEELLS
jgi:rhamnosyl/mannosyltransferase